MIQSRSYERSRVSVVSTSTLLLYAALATFFAALLFVGIVWTYYE